MAGGFLSLHLDTETPGLQGGADVKPCAAGLALEKSEGPSSWTLFLPVSSSWLAQPL